jgi:large subunit ribosomal protein L6
MSRIGKQSITIKDGTTVTIKQAKKLYEISAKGPKGELSRSFPVGGVLITQKDNIIALSTASDDLKSKALWGLYRTLVNNLVVGVSEGFTKKLEMKGVGYKAEMKGTTLSIAAGYSHPVLVESKDGVQFDVTNGVIISVIGIDKEKVGNTAAKIRSIRPPEPYKGKGIRYEGEVVRRKVNKSLKK